MFIRIISVHIENKGGIIEAIYNLGYSDGKSEHDTPKYVKIIRDSQFERYYLTAANSTNFENEDDVEEHYEISNSQQMVRFKKSKYRFLYKEAIRMLKKCEKIFLTQDVVDKLDNSN